MTKKLADLVAERRARTEDDGPGDGWDNYCDLPRDFVHAPSWAVVTRCDDGWAYGACPSSLCSDTRHSRREAERLAIEAAAKLARDTLAAAGRYVEEPTRYVPRDTLPAPAIVAETEQSRRHASPWTATGRDLDALLDAAGTVRLDSDDEEARGQLLRLMYPRGPAQVVAVLEAGILEARRARPYGELFDIDDSGHEIRTAAAIGTAWLLAWAVSGERLPGETGERVRRGG